MNRSAGRGAAGTAAQRIAHIALAIATLLLWSLPGQPSTLSEWFLRAQAFEQQGNYGLASDHYERYLAGSPFSVNKRIAKTRLAILQKGLQRPRDAGLPLYLRALSARERGDYRLALEHLQTLLQLNPQSVFAADASYLKAYIELMDRFDYTAALVQMQHIATIADDQYLDTARYSQAIALEQLGRFNEARQAFAKIRDRHAVVASDLLGLYLARGNFQSRFWFSRASRRIESIDRFRAVQLQADELIGGDFSLAIGARYHYDQPVGSGGQYRYIWNILNQHNLPATHFTHWYTRSTDWRWESAGPLLAATEAGLTPVITHWWFGDEISPQFVREHRTAYLDNIERHLVPILQKLPDAIVLLEPEFNKRGIEQWPEWDDVASDAISAIKRGAPHVRVGLVIGDWAAFEDNNALSNIDNAVALSDFVGFMLMTSAANEGADLNPVWSVRERVQRSAHALQQRWGKPIYFGYMALSSAGNWRARQAEYLRQLMAYAPMLASYGVFGVGYFSLLDNPAQQGWFGTAENHFGLLQADNTEKPAAGSWRRGAAEILKADRVAPIIKRDLHLQAGHRFAASFNEWVRWQLLLTGQASAASRHIRGAGNQLFHSWHGEADEGSFINETIAARLIIEDKGGNRKIQTLQLQHHCAQTCTSVRPVALDSGYAQTIATRNGSTAKIRSDGVLQIRFPARHAAAILPLSGDLANGDRIRMQISANEIVEGLRIGLIDERHFQIDLPLELFLDSAEAGWHSINIAVDEFPDNARRFGRDGKQLQFGELNLNGATRLIVQQRLHTGTIAIQALRTERP